jgi:hypothetical protein
MNARASYGERGDPAPSWHQESWPPDLYSAREMHIAGLSA